VRVLVCGDRNWMDRKKIEDRLLKLPVNTVVIEGEASGADSLARDVAREIGLSVLEFPADWKKHGKAAGPIRNRQMLDQKPDLVIAFHPDLTKSRGTADTVREAKRRGIPVEVIG
jgi:hypothetical protein